MSTFNRRTNIERTRNAIYYFASEYKFNRGNVSFEDYTEVSTYEDGTVKTERKFTKTDGREYTSWGHRYSDYKNEKGFKAAMSRIKKDRCVSVEAAELW